MNLPEKTLRFLPAVVMLWVGSVITLNAQNWQEYHVLNQGNSLSFTRGVLFPGNIIQYPDPEIGTLTGELTGSTWNLNFTPVEGAVGVAEFIIEYFPNQLPPAPKIESFRVYVADSYIEAKKDFFTVVENSADDSLFVLANDIPHPGSAILSVGYVAAAVNGSASMASDGQSILFSPDADFTGMAYLTYVVCDNFGACTNAETDICVMASGPIPDEDTIYLSTNCRAPVTAFLPVAGFEVTENPDHGVLTNLSPDTWEYQPDAGYAGTDAFVMSTDTLIRHFIVDVFYKDAPNTFVNPDIIFTRVDSAVTFNVLSNDVKAYPVDAYTTPEKGQLTFDAPGTFTYTPDSGYVGAQAFTYTTCFLTNCETGDVIVYVGDMVPENTETYDLVTTKDVPLVINYEIPLDGYTFVIHADPTEGDLDLYNDAQSIDVLCSTVTGYDLLVYTPPDGYTGSDYFEIVYCIDGGECHLVKINVTVEDVDPQPCPCVDHCVWPGDADGSGRVDLNDLLSIGWQMGVTGPERDYPDNTAWMGQTGDDWSSDLWGMNSKFADSDGDGVIAAADMQSVGDYYLRAHTLVPEVIGLKSDYQFDIIPLTEEVDSGDVAVFEISIGSESNPVVDMHGFAFSLNLPTDLVDSASLTMDFYDDSWLGHDAPTLQMKEQPWNGRLDAAVTRTSGKPASGIGVIGIMTFIVTDDIDGFKVPGTRVPIQIGVNSANSMSGSGLLYDVPGETSTIYLTHGSELEKSLEDNAFVYPNPSGGDHLSVHVNGDRALRQIDLYDLSGSLLASYPNLTEKGYSPDISNLGSGLYILRITATDGVVSRKFEVLK